MHKFSLPSGFVVHFFDVLPSTMDMAHTLAFRGAPGKTVVVVRTQTRGRGQRGRFWCSKDGNAHFSVILRPSEISEEPFALSFLFCVAVGEALARLIPAHQASALMLTYKWPNDVLLNGSKVAGVLLEAETDPGSLAQKWIVGGVGVNLCSSPDGVSFSATALSHHGVECAVEAFVSQFCQTLENLLNVYRSHGFKALRDMWWARAHGRNQWIKVQQVNDSVSGILSGINLQGELVLKTDQGESRMIRMGEVQGCFAKEPPEDIDSSSKKS